MNRSMFAAVFAEEVVGFIITGHIKRCFAILIPRIHIRTSSD